MNLQPETPKVTWVQVAVTVVVIWGFITLLTPTAMTLDIQPLVGRIFGLLGTLMQAVQGFQAFKKARP